LIDGGPKLSTRRARLCRGPGLRPADCADDQFPIWRKSAAWDPSGN